ncbi:26922_t:CDS:2, partial [Gigaspora margarita]
FMNNIKNKTLSTSFYEEVVDLMIDSSSEGEVSNMDNIVDISDVEEFQYDQVDSEFKESKAKSLVEEPIDNEELIDNDQEISEIACFISRFRIKTIIYSSIPVEYLAISPE